VTKNCWSRWKIFVRILFTAKCRFNHG